jgi:hypothetical protein
MCRKELIKILDVLGVNRSLYTFDTNLPEDKYTLNKKGRQWEVYYSERGSKFDNKVFESNLGAVKYFIKKLLDNNESILVGNWIEKGGTVIQDSICKRIHWLTKSHLEQLYVDGENWSALYKNPDDGIYWELIYPKSYMHGGGPPTLQKLSERDAYKKYNIAKLTN